MQGFFCGKIPLATVSSEDRTFDYLSDPTLVSSSTLRRLGSDPGLNEKPSQGSHDAVRVCVRVRKVKTEMKVKGHYIQDNVLSPEELHLT